MCAGGRNRETRLARRVTALEDDIRFGAVETDVKLLAFYASPVWSSSVSWAASIKGHAQPTQPNAELGHYDPFDWRTLKQQAQMAKRHGVHGFCFDLNVSPDATIEAQPVGQILAHDEIEICFLVQLAAHRNVPLSLSPRRWRGFSRIGVRYASKVGLSLSLKWRTTSTAPPSSWLNCDDDSPSKASRHRLLLVGGRGLEIRTQRWQLSAMPCLIFPRIRYLAKRRCMIPSRKTESGAVPYGVIVSNGVARITQAQKLDRLVYHSVTLARDNTTGDSSLPLVYTRFHIRDYRRWLDAAVASTRAIHRDDRRLSS